MHACACAWVIEYKYGPKHGGKKCSDWMRNFLKKGAEEEREERERGGGHRAARRAGGPRSEEWSVSCSGVCFCKAFFRADNV